jgi:cobalamin biosynthesis protein CobD/CbiB
VSLFLTVGAALLLDALLGEPKRAHPLVAFGRLADWSQVVQLRGLQRQLVVALLLSQEQGNAVIRLPSQVVLAALLSTTRESIARTLNQLAKLGLLRRIDRRHCEVMVQDLSCFAAIDENG